MLLGTVSVGTLVFCHSVTARTASGMPTRLANSEYYRAFRHMYTKSPGSYRLRLNIHEMHGIDQVIVQL